MNTIDAAIAVSTNGANHRPSGARPRAAATSVIECAAVNAVTTGTSGRSRRIGMTRHSTKSR